MEYGRPAEVQGRIVVVRWGEPTYEEGSVCVFGIRIAAS